MKTFLMVVKRWTWLMMAMMVARAGAQSAQSTPPPPASSPVNRWLLIVDIARNLEPHADAVGQALARIINSDMAAQFRPGDTVGVWTYSDTLQTGVFPLQEWRPGRTHAISTFVSQFVATQKYDRPLRQGRVMPAVRDIVEHSDFITILYVSDGHEKMQGTPFDDRINQAYRLGLPSVEAGQLPFVTVLRAAHGKFTDYFVTTLNWQLQLPPLPPELAPLPVALVETNVAKPAPPKPVVAPLIVHGPKPEPPAPPKTNPPAAPPVPVIVTQVVVMAPTSAPPAAVATNEAASAGANAPGATPPGSLSPGVWILIGAGGALVIVLLYRNAQIRAARRASSITRALDRERK
jgi:hypothetical protein